MALCQDCSVVLQMLLSLSCYVRLQSTHGVAMPLSCVHSIMMVNQPRSPYLPSRAKLWCMYAPAKRADTLPLFLLYLICTLWLDSPTVLRGSRIQNKKVYGWKRHRPQRLFISTCVACGSFVPVTSTLMATAGGCI